MDTLVQDIRFALRTLWKGKGVTAAAALALALGIGANSALFSVVDAVLLRPMPFEHPDRVVKLTGNFRGQDLPNIPLSWPEYLDVAAARSLEARGAWTEGSGVLQLGGAAERIEMGYADGAFFDTLGVKPILGRNFLLDENQAGKNKVVLLSHGFWRKRFNGDPAVVGKGFVLDAETMTVIGVLPEGFSLRGDRQMWQPFGLDADQMSEMSRGSRYVRVLGRLKPGLTVGDFRRELPQFSKQIAEAHPKNYKANDWHLTTMLLADDLIGSARKSLLLLLGAVACVLLIACANVANLLLSRAAARQRELAVRAALGAGRARLVRQLLTESVLLAALGAAGGLLFAAWGVEALVALAPQGVPGLLHAHIDLRVTGFAAALALSTGVLFGLAPALAATRSDLVQPLKEGAHSGKSGGTLRASLVVAEVALALVLLIGAGLLLRSFARLMAVKSGFDTRGVIAARISLSGPRYDGEKGREAAALLYQDLMYRAQGLPGVEVAGGISTLPMSGGRGDWTFNIEGYTPDPDVGHPDAEWRSVAPGYFQSLAIPLLSGRAFTGGDDRPSARVAIVSETLVRKFMGGQDPIGRRIALTARAPNDEWRTIVGVASDVRDQGFDQEPRPMLYLPVLQFPVAELTVTLRTKGATVNPTSMHALGNALRSELQRIDSTLPVDNVRTFESIVSGSTAPRRFPMQLLAAFAALALALSAIGIYGVMSYSVEQRTHEIGVRMAVGAEARDVLRLVVGQGLRLALIGVGIGLCASLALARVLAGLLYGVSASDPLTYAGIASLLVLVALLACWMPARRATAVDPVIALRAE